MASTFILRGLGVYLHTVHLEGTPWYVASFDLRLGIFSDCLVLVGNAFHSLGPQYLREWRPYVVLLTRSWKNFSPVRDSTPVASKILISSCYYLVAFLLQVAHCSAKLKWGTNRPKWSGSLSIETLSLVVTLVRLSRMMSIPVKLHWNWKSVRQQTRQSGKCAVSMTMTNFWIMPASQSLLKVFVGFQCSSYCRKR